MASGLLFHGGGQDYVKRVRVRPSNEALLDVFFTWVIYLGQGVYRYRYIAIDGGLHLEIMCCFLVQKRSLLINKLTAREHKPSELLAAVGVTRPRAFGSLPVDLLPN